MLTIHHSNRLEALADELAAVMREPLDSPFSGEVVVVQSRGVARWLSLKLADRVGVCANVRFLFPSAFAWELYRSVLQKLPEQSPYDPELLKWSVYQLLPELEPAPPFAAVANYVRNDPLNRYALASRVSALYDEYLVYRPELIETWDRNAPREWQGLLWRRLAERAGTPHRAKLQKELLQALRANASARDRLPERVALFGTPALPPALLELFSAVAAASAVHVFALNPCREYWGDIAGSGEIARKSLTATAEAQYLETGNRLLASLGKQGRDVLDLLTAGEGEHAVQREHFVEPEGTSLLQSIQRDILNLNEPAHDGGLGCIEPRDRSLQVHCCHSGMREVEVLHDQLLDLFSLHPDLEPSKVVVMTPDIEKYAPYIEAVFATAEPRIPFSISDRSGERASTLAATFMSLLDLAGSRYEANGVLAILDEPAVRRRYALSETDLETVRRWVRESQIRWGIDADHRARFGVPPAHEHTWRFGLDRLLLGYAMPGRNEKLFAGVLPYDEVEGSLGVVLGRFQSFAEAAIALDTLLAEARPVHAWCEILHALISRFFDPTEDRAEELEAVRGSIAALDRQALAAGCVAAVPLAVVATALRDSLDAPGRAFLSGGVTFCAMVPMRSLPFEVVCMIGMNDGAFPRMRRRDGFDLMAADFRKGDRSRREDDRYLFLESIVSARRVLYLSYTGRNIRDDSVIPPAVLVSELLDYVDDNYRTNDPDSIRAALLTVHPLQAFSRRYFRGESPLFSYSNMLADAARLAGRGDKETQPLVAEDLPPPAEEARSVGLETLISFFRNPTRYFLRERLGIRLEEAEDEIEPHEPFALATLDAYGLKQQLLDLELRGGAPAALAVAHAAGVLPHGALGDALFQREHDDVQVFARRLEPLLRATRLEPVTLGTDCGHLKLVGTLRGVTTSGLLLYRAAKLTANDRIGAWIRHLALNSAGPAEGARITRCVAQDCTLTFAPVGGARERLRKLLELYCEGLRRPLHFFPKASCDYAHKRDVAKAQKVWMGADRARGERDENAYYRLAFRAGDPIDAEFERLAGVVFDPMLEALKRGEAA